MSVNNLISMKTDSNLRNVNEKLFELSNNVNEFSFFVFLVSYVLN